MRTILISVAVAIVLASCSGQSESSVETGAGTASQEEPRAVAPSPDFELWVHADENPPYAFALAGAGKSTDELRLLILEEAETPDGLKRRLALTSKGESADFAVSFADLKDRPLSHPRALLAVRDRSNEGLQRVFIVFEGTTDAGPAHAVGEVLVNLNRLERGELPVTIGRVFSLPVHGSLTGVRLSAGPGDSRLTVNIPALGGDPSQPVILVYDISPDAKTLDPVDILMAPSK